jgi:hypothetical protein
LDLLRRQFLPDGGPRTRPFEVVLVFVVAGFLAFFRLGNAAVHARIWAEDGRVFMGQADAHGSLRAITIGYAGYSNAVPRLAAAAVHALPIRLWGAGLHVVDATIVAGVALLVYVALVGHVHSRLGRALAALYVVLVPVGPEIVGSIANLQWFLIVGAVVALLWSPRTGWGWAAICISTFAATTTSPLGAVVFVCALARWILRRSFGNQVILGVTALGFGSQVVEMVHSPQRRVTDVFGQHGASALARGYLTRVVGDGVLGMDRLPAGIGPSAMGRNALAGGVVVLVLAAVALLGGARRWSAPWLVTLFLLALSVGVFLASVLLQPVPLPLDDAVFGGRYYAAPAMFLVIGLIVLGAGLTERLGAAWAGGLSIPEKGARVVLGLACLALLAGLTYGTTTTYNEAHLFGRNSTTTWSQAVRTAARICREQPDLRHISVPILPQPKWAIRLRCASLRSV